MCSMITFQRGATAVIVDRGDLTRRAVDAIVNAANSSLMGGGGVDGAIHRAGGPAILEACRRLRERDFPHGLPVGEAVLTTAGRLPARAVIHTVGPVYQGGRAGEEELLRAAYRNSLDVARRAGLRRIAFPAISCGVYGYPLHRAAPAVLDEIALVIDQWPTAFDEVHLVLYGQAAYDAFLTAARDVLGSEGTTP